MINIQKLAEQQKNQRALKGKNRLLEQTHDIKLAESLSPITKKLNEVKETARKIGDVVKESQPETPQLALENIPSHQPIENNEGVIKDTEFEKILMNTSVNNGFFKTYYDRERGGMMNGYPIKILRETETEINDKNYNITPGIQKVLVDSKYKTAKSMSDTEKLIFRNMLQKKTYYNRIPTK